jgi:methionyl-tRNA formyltransferase
MGTPEFAVEPLRKLFEAGIEIAAVVTVMDKPAGRGQKLVSSPVKIFAEEHNLAILQPEKLKDPVFIDQLRKINADLFVVVAFRMLPEIVWSMPRKGTINLHASLLPRYRGAAPIHHAILNGEKETGVTTFFISHDIDTGHIIAQHKVEIGENETTGELYEKLMRTGADLLVETVKNIRDEKYTSIPQEQYIQSEETLPHAPKIFRENGLIIWNETKEKIHNLVRGMNPFPGAFTTLHLPGEPAMELKIFSTQKNNEKGEPGTIRTDNNTFLRIYCSNGSIDILELQSAGTC